MGIIRATMFMVGASIGAGFLSGAELVRFFSSEFFLPAVIISSVLFFFLSLLFLSYGRKYGGYEESIAQLFRRRNACGVGRLTSGICPACIGGWSGFCAVIFAARGFRNHDSQYGACPRTAHNRICVYGRGLRLVLPACAASDGGNRRGDFICGNERAFSRARNDGGGCKDEKYNFARIVFCADYLCLCGLHSWVDLP